MSVGIDSIAVVITAIATLVTAIGAVIVGLINAKIGLTNAKKLDQVHESTNGKMEELLRVVRAASFAEGAKSETDKVPK